MPPINATHILITTLLLILIGVSLRCMIHELIVIARKHGVAAAIVMGLLFVTCGIYGSTKPTPPDPPDPEEIHVWQVPLYFHPETHRLYLKGGSILLLE